MGSSFLPGRVQEKSRYEEHDNNVFDPGYRGFVEPIVDAVCDDFTAESKGLDFGAGTGPVISKMLAERGFEIFQYDPFFHPDESLLSFQYDYIVCCEVVEHFHNPHREFRLLRSLLSEGGRLYCKTSLLREEREFDSWHYKDDPTHVFFYSLQSFEFIRDFFGFKSLEVHRNMVVLGS
jgi:2-polyprenyl-3-methyl-5-hydroxy-6-metoxy-1,4-benzoquinol methylase